MSRTAIHAALAACFLLVIPSSASSEATEPARGFGSRPDGRAWRVTFEKQTRSVTLQDATRQRTYSFDREEDARAAYLLARNPMAEWQSDAGGHDFLVFDIPTDDAGGFDLHGIAAYGIGYDRDRLRVHYGYVGGTGIVHFTGDSNAWFADALQAGSFALARTAFARAQGSSTARYSFHLGGR